MNIITAPRPNNIRLAAKIATPTGPTGAIDSISQPRLHDPMPIVIDGPGPKYLLMRPPTRLASTVPKPRQT